MVVISWERVRVWVCEGRMRGEIERKEEARAAFEES